MNFLPHQITSMQQLVNNSRLLKPEGKAVFLAFLDKGEPFPREFLEALAALIDSEQQYSTAELTEISQKIKTHEQELAQAESNLDSFNKQLEQNYPIYIEDRKNEALAEIKKIDAQFDNQAEDVVGEVEDEKVQAIHRFLHQAKPTDSSK